MPTNVYGVGTGPRACPRAFAWPRRDNLGERRRPCEHPGNITNP